MKTLQNKLLSTLFALTLVSGYALASEHGEKCGTGKCGTGMDKKIEKSMKCGDGKKEEKMSKCGTGKCGDGKKEEKMTKCGTGKCGGGK